MQGHRCEYCGKTGLHKPGKDCPVYGKQCLKCAKFNHFAACCKSEKKTEQKPIRSKQVQKVTNKPERESSSRKSDSEYLELSSKYLLLHLRKVRICEQKETVMVRLGDTDVHIKPHSGASVRLMDEYRFKALSHLTKKINNLKPCQKTLKTIQTFMSKVNF